MARGTSRAPSQNAYRGSIGRTQTTTAHVTGPSGDTSPSQVYSTVDAVSDPELAERLRAGTLNGDIPVPVLYHDPAAELMVLVLVAVLTGLHIASPKNRAVSYGVVAASLLVLWFGVKLTYG